MIINGTTFYLMDIYRYRLFIKIKTMGKMVKIMIKNLMIIVKTKMIK